MLKSMSRLTAAVASHFGQKQPDSIEMEEFMDSLEGQIKDLGFDVSASKLQNPQLIILKFSHAGNSEKNSVSIAEGIFLVGGDGSRVNGEVKQCLWSERETKLMDYIGQRIVRSGYKPAIDKLLPNRVPVTAPALRLP